MNNWSTFTVGLAWILTWINFSYHTSAVRVYDQERLSHLRDEVKTMFYHAYDSYIQHAYPFDELMPLSCAGQDTWSSCSLTLIDTLDTLAILGNFSEFRRVAQLIIDNTQFDMNINVSVFETNIRIIGGLLSAHLLSQKAGMEVDKGWPCNGPLLHLAEKVARKLLPAFDTKTGMPFGTVNLRYGVPAKETPITCTAGVGTFLVEFGTLSRLTGDPLYEKVALRALHSLYSKRSKLDLFGNHIDTDTGKWTAVDSGIGAGVDSFFEYLVKGGILFQKPELMNMFRVSFDAIEKHLGKGGWYIWATMGHGHVSATTFQSLEAYWPGLLSLVGEFRPGLKAIANYHRIWKQYGALPELYNILHGKATNLREGYPLRPELVESAMYLYRATGDPYMLEIGEDILHSIKTTMKTECGFATVRDVTSLTLEDRMESFFLAETVKYLYLLFDPNNFIHNDGEDYTVIENPMGQCTVYAGGYIFNTEAHPIDPSALNCCTGVTEQELHDEMAVVDDLRTSPKFHGRAEDKTERRHKQAPPSSESDSAEVNLSEQETRSSDLEQGSTTKGSFSTRSTGDDSPQLITTKPEIPVKHPPSSLSSILEGLDLQVTFDDDTTGTVTTSSSYCEKDKESFLQLTKSSSQTCAASPKASELKVTAGGFREKISSLEKLLDRLLEEQKKGGFEFSPSVTFLGTDGKESASKSVDVTSSGSSGIVTQKTLSDEVKAIEKLIQKFEINENPIPIGPNKERKKSRKKRQWKSESSSSSSTDSIPTTQHRIQEQGFNETPDLDLIFGSPTPGRSLSFYFSLKWLHNFPELITQLIPSERFDIQNFYSRLNQQFSDEGFAKEFNLTISWTKDYEALKCDTPGFADRFLFHKSSPPN